MPELRERVPLYDGDALIRWVDEDEARELIRAGCATLLRTKRRIRALRLRARPVAGGQRPAARDPLRRFHYSHTRETDENPAGVWTLMPYRVLIQGR